MYERHGYSMLPTPTNPTSTMTLRLTAREMDERNDWIRSEFNNGMTFEAIAKEVGLSVQRVYQIVNPPKRKLRQNAKIQTKPRTPRDVAMDELFENRIHKACRSFDGMCNTCFGNMSLVESEYDDSGWPYSWAMYGQEEFITKATDDRSKEYMRRLSDVK